MKGLLFAMCCFAILRSQSIDITGRVAAISEFLSYDQVSQLNIDTTGYSRTDKIPGLSETLNISLFGRMKTMELSVVADIKNFHEWQPLTIDDVSRLSLSVATKYVNVTLGDFYEFVDPRFLSNQDIRGAKLEFSYKTRLDSRTNKFSTFYGRNSRERNTTDLIFRQFETYQTSASYERRLFHAIHDFHLFDALKLTGSVSVGNDLENFHLNTVINPLENNVYGVQGNTQFFNEQFELGGSMFYSQTDSLKENAAPSQTSNGFLIDANLGYNSEYVQLKLKSYQYGETYYSMGNPFFENDREGIDLTLNLQAPEITYLSTYFQKYQNNLANDTTFTTQTFYQRYEVGTLWKHFNIVTSLSFQSDESDIILAEEVETFLNKSSSSFKLDLSLEFKQSRFSTSFNYINYEDNSQFQTGTGISSEQYLFSFNYFFSGIKQFESSGGMIFTTSISKETADTDNLFFYTSSRYTIIPQMLRFEAEINLSVNGVEQFISDSQEEREFSELSNMLNDFYTFSGKVALEYFLNFNISAKLYYTNENRVFDYLKNYSVLELQQRLNSIGDKLYFNKNETYYSHLLGIEINVLF